MRIACVDKTASDRLRLEKLLDDAFRDCRKSIGHMIVARFFPASKEELLINSCPDAGIIGPALGCDDALLFARDVASVHADLPLFVFLDSAEYTVKNIKRFEPYVKEVFSAADSPSRFVYSLTSVAQKDRASSRGLLFAVQGVKGGVGTTSIAGAIAHAAQSLGKSVALVDLSQRGELAQFFLSDRWQSSEYATLLSEKIIPEVEHLDRVMVLARNGIWLLPPPAGAGEMRELWLRDPSRLEVPLAMIDLLQERFDLVVVDFASAEGIFPFAIECRADARIYISANEPGSLHLLTSRVDDFEITSEGITRFLINRTSPQGLTREDILDFISWSPKFTEDMLYPLEIPYDSKGGLWVGTGNSLYTEGNAKLKTAIESFTRDALGMDATKDKKIRIPFASSLHALAERTLPERKKKEINFEKQEALPFLAGAGKQDAKNKVRSSTHKHDVSTWKVGNDGKEALISRPTLYLPPRTVTSRECNKDVFDFQHPTNHEGPEDLGLVYEPPRLTAKE